MPTTTETNNTPKKKILWAIIIGVNQYQDFNDLNYCANDAVGLANALETIATQELPIQGAIFDEVKIIVHAHTSNKYSREGILPPEHNSILASLGELSEAQPQDTVLFYFSGHGHYYQKINDTILCLEATNQNNLAGTGLLITTVLAKITNSLAQQQLIWLDACHSGGVASQLLDAILRVTKKSPNLNLYCITACDRDQKSFETPYLQHGIFTNLLLQALEKGKAATLVKADALYQFIVGEIEQSIINIIKLDEQIHNIQLDDERKKSLQFKPQRIVVGNGEFIIGGYPNPITDNRLRGALVLDGCCPSQDIVDISNSLACKGAFAFQPYPNKSESLQDSIAALLTSAVTQTALLYLKGKFETDDNEVWLVCSDGERINVNWLAKQLQDSPIEQQIIILDCYPTSDVASYTKLLEQSEKSQCIVAISVADNWLSREFIEIIENNSQNGLTATNLISQLQTIVDNSDICTSQQRHIYRSARGILNVILDEKQHLLDIAIDRNYCPYKGLTVFTFADRDFYYGRGNLRDEIIQQLAIKHFLLIVGASGSGKSSLVQAGVVPKWLQNGLSDSEHTRQVWIMRPEKHPLRELAKAFSQQTIFSALEKYSQEVEEKKLSSDYIEGILNLGVESFVTWLSQQPHRVGLLVIDQFEEIFTISTDFERELFLKLILGTVKAMDGSLKVISTLRSDFITPWLETPKLKEKVGQEFAEYSIFIPSELSEAEYRDIITKPATRVGLGVEPELVNVLVEEVVTEKGALPLLQLTLEKLWQEREAGKLSLAVYQKKIGGIKQVLQKKADAVYQQLTEEEQKCAQWIFTQLVSLGEGKEDTKLRKDIKDLHIAKYSDELFNSTLNQLRDSRLIVISNPNQDLKNSKINQLAASKGIEESHVRHSSNNNKTQISRDLGESHNSEIPEITVEIAHEILIRNWSSLRWWLNTNREHIRQRNKIEERAKQADDLLGDTALAQVEEFYLKYSDEFTDKAQDFIGRSIEKRDKDARLAKRRRRQVIGGLTGGIVAMSMVAGAALWQLRKATINEIEALNNSLEISLLSDSTQSLDTLVTGLKTAIKIEKSWFKVDDQTNIQVLGKLEDILSQLREVNYLENKNNAKCVRRSEPNPYSDYQPHYSVSTVYPPFFDCSNHTYSQIIVDKGDTVRLWNLPKKTLHTLQGHTDIVFHVAFSPDGETIASSSEDGTIKLWTKQGQLIKTLEGHKTGVGQIAFSPDGEIIASASKDKTIKLWNLKGELINTLVGHIDSIHQIAWSLDSEVIASAGGDQDNTMKLWNRQGKLLKSLQIKKDRDPRIIHEWGWINHIVFSPNSKIIASLSKHTIRLWNQEGDLIETLDNNIDNNYLAFSPNNQTIAYISESNKIKLWNQQNNSIKTLDSYGVYENYLVFSFDGNFLASTGNDGTIKLWNQQGDLIKTLVGHNGEVNHLVFSPNNQILASAGKDGTIKLWNLDGELLNTLIGHTGYVNRLAFSLDGKTIASASSDGTIKLWNSYLDNVMTRSCDLVKDYLTNNPNVNPEDRKMCDKYYSQPSK